MATRFSASMAVAGAAAVLAALVAFALAPVAAGGAAPSCSTVSSATVQAALGGTQANPGTGSTSTNSYDGYKATVLGCTYSSAVNISYSTPATAANFDKALATLKQVAGAKTVSGIGQGAFSGTGSNTISNCNAKTGKCTNKNVTDDNLWFLVTGKAIVEISATASSAIPAGEETLARKIVAAL